MIVVVAVLNAVGCGSSNDTVDASKAEQGIENSSLNNSTTQITSASCPSDAKKEKGGTFTCDVKLSGGGKAEVTVTQTSNHNTFSYAYKSGSVVLPGSEVDKELEQDLADAGVKDAQVNCPSSTSWVCFLESKCGTEIHTGTPSPTSRTDSSTSRSPTMKSPSG